MPRAFRVCPCLGCTAHEGSCPELTPGGKCSPCRTAGDLRRGTSKERGYNTAHWRARRGAFLSKEENVFCRLCSAPSSVADHFPLSRRELLDQGVRDPDLPEYLRPLCRPCHSRETAKHQAGGWARR
jgi:5-methylcytosine-specific restriction protein A